jgi:hypothetical protein
MPMRQPGTRSRWTHRARGFEASKLGFIGVLALVAAGVSSPLLAQSVLEDPEEQVIHYQADEGLRDPVAKLQKRLADGKARLKFDSSRGYLPAVLEALGIPVSSQGLAFSKTSSQRERIGPKTPRAVYFSDDVSVGWVPGGSVIEVISVDPNRGPIFYTLEQNPSTPVKFTRRTECMECHLGPKTVNVPGLIVKSVHTATDGTPISQVDGFVSGHNSSLSERWGGWYVTGSSAGDPHLGNTFVTGGNPERKGAAEVNSLEDRFDTSRYLSGGSDIVALMVLEHQARMQNLITAANYEARYALNEEGDLVGTNLVGAASQRRIAPAGEMLLEYMLFRNEAALHGRVKGSPAFAVEFQKRGPRDGKGRSLRQLDLNARLFRYPCS